MAVDARDGAPAHGVGAVGQGAREGDAQFGRVAGDALRRRGARDGGAGRVEELDRRKTGVGWFGEREDELARRRGKRRAGGRLRAGEQGVGARGRRRGAEARESQCDEGRHDSESEERTAHDGRRGLARSAGRCCDGPCPASGALPPGACSGRGRRGAGRPLGDRPRVAPPRARVRLSRLPSAAAAPALAQVSTDGRVRQQRHLAGALDGDGDLTLVTTAGAGHATRLDLAALADAATQRVQVFVVDADDLVFAEMAVTTSRGIERTTPLSVGTWFAFGARHVRFPSAELVCNKKRCRRDRSRRRGRRGDDLRRQRRPPRRR